MSVGVRVTTAVAAALVTVAAAAGPIAPEALKHRLVAGERFVYESTVGGKNSLLATRTEFTVLEVTPARTIVREQEFMWDRLSFEGTIETERAQGSWHYTSHGNRAPSIVPVWDPEQYGHPPSKAVSHRIMHLRDGDEDVTQHVLSNAPDAITITVEGMFRSKPAETAGGNQTIAAVSRIEMTWTGGVLSEFRYTISTTVTVNGRASPSFEGQTIHRLVEHTVPQ